MPARPWSSLPQDAPVQERAPALCAEIPVTARPATCQWVDLPAETRPAPDHDRREVEDVAKGSVGTGIPLALPECAEASQPALQPGTLPWSNLPANGAVVPPVGKADAGPAEDARDAAAPVKPHVEWTALSPDVSGEDGTVRERSA